MNGFDSRLVACLVDLGSEKDGLKTVRPVSVCIPVLFSKFIIMCLGCFDLINYGLHRKKSYFFGVNGLVLRLVACLVDLGFQQG